MGLVYSLFVGLPIGLGVGCCLGPCASRSCDTSSLERKCCSVSNKVLFPSLLAIGIIGLYVPLIVLCAKYDGESVATAMYSGACWSTGGRMPYTNLGLCAGIFTGIGLTGCLWLLIARLRGSAAADQDQAVRFVDVEDGPEATFTNDDEQ